MCPILKLDHDDEERERIFHLKYLLSLTTAQRFEMMIRQSDEIIKRPCCEDDEAG